MSYITEVIHEMQAKYFILGFAPIALMACGSTLLLAGCADDVGGRMQVVKTDMQQIQQKLAITPSSVPSTLGKSSTLSITARFYGTEAQKVVSEIGLAASSIGYRQVSSQIQSDGSYVLFCHNTEPGRSISIARSFGEASLATGFILATVPVALFTWPLRFPELRTSATMNGVQTMVEGAPTAAGWMQYTQGVVFFGACGALSGLVFWLVWRRGGSTKAHPASAR